MCKTMFYRYWWQLIQYFMISQVSAEAFEPGLSVDILYILSWQSRPNRVTQITPQLLYPMHPGSEGSSFSSFLKMALNPPVITWPQPWSFIPCSKALIVLLEYLSGVFGLGLWHDSKLFVHWEGEMRPVTWSISLCLLSLAPSSFQTTNNDH